MKKISKALSNKKDIEKFLVEAEKLNLEDDEVLIVKVGSAEQNIFPTEQELETCKKLVEDAFRRPIKLLVVPDMFKFEIIKINKGNKIKVKDVK